MRMSAEASTHPGRKSVLELLGRPERPALRVVGPGDGVGVVLGHGLEVPAVEGLVTGAVRLDVAGCHDSSSCGRWPSMTRASWRPLLARTLPSPFPDLSLCLPSQEGRQGPLNQGRLMSGWAKARIQLCGRFVVDIDGSRIEDTLPGRRGRVLFAYLVLNRGRALPRDELLMAGWGEDAPAEASNALSVLLSKLRHGLGAGHLRGRSGDRAADATGDLRRRRGGLGGRPPGGVLPSPRAGGRRHGARPGSPTTSPPGPSSPG